MKQSRSIPWPRIFAEGTIILVSILLAFWIDAWWDGRQAKAAEEVVLQTLLDDLLAKRQLLNERNRFVGAIRESAETLLRISSGRLKSPDEDSIDELISDVWWVSNEAQWTSAPLESLAASGDLSLISNPHLVQSLEALRVAKIERCLDLLEIGLPGVEHQLDYAIRMLQAQLEVTPAVR